MEFQFMINIEFHRRSAFAHGARSLLVIGTFAWLLATLAMPALAQQNGRIAGRITNAEGQGTSGVYIILGERVAVSDSTGRYALEGVAPGEQTLSFTLGDNTETQNVTVNAGETTNVDLRVDWKYTIADTLTVYSASRQVERITDAPSAVAKITLEQIEREAAHGQLAKIFESAPGVDVTQSGLYDFKLNVRGANLSVNRRVAVLIDGRDPSFPSLGSQEWAGVSFPVDSLASAELIRGPSSALYGANSFNGVINLTTKAPQDYLGGTLRLTGGDLDTRRADLIASYELGTGWYTKIVGAYQEGEDFSVSRTTESEYASLCTLAPIEPGCLRAEIFPVANENEVSHYGLRFDRDFGNGRSLVVEGGQDEFTGPVYVSSAGRFEFEDVSRPFARMNFHTPHWNVHGSYTGREATVRNLGDPGVAFLDSSRTNFEIQGNQDFAEGRGRVVGGIQIGAEDVDSPDPVTGRQTFIPGPKSNDKEAVFGQLDYEISDRLKVVVAARWDDSTFQDAQVSPQVAFVASPNPAHTFRFSYREAFLTANYPELFVRVPVAPAAPLLDAEAICAAEGVACGLDRLTFNAVGNPDLGVEKIESLELGWSAIFQKALLNVELYQADTFDFIQVGTILPSSPLAPYAPPEGLSADASARLLAALDAGLGPFRGLLANPDDWGRDRPFLALVGIANAGEVRTRGLELSLDVAPASGWNLEFNYSFLDFEEQQTGLVPVIANSPEHKANFGATYVAEKFSVSARLRWVDEFRWVDTVVDGIVPSYEVVNVFADWQLNESWQLGLNVSNLFDNEHFEFFSGDLMGRRALLNLAYSW